MRVIVRLSGVGRGAWIAALTLFVVTAGCRTRDTVLTGQVTGAQTAQDDVLSPVSDAGRASPNDAADAATDAAADATAPAPTKEAFEPCLKKADCKLGYCVDDPLCACSYCAPPCGGTCTQPGYVCTTVNVPDEGFVDVCQLSCDCKAAGAKCGGAPGCAASCGACAPSQACTGFTCGKPACDAPPCGCSQDLDCGGDGDLCKGKPFCDTSKSPPRCAIKAGSVPSCAGSACASANCDPLTGACKTNPVLAGTTCGQGNECVLAACDGQGACKATPVADGTPCGSAGKFGQ